MTAVTYPVDLPCPSSAALQFAERRQLSTLPGPRSSRVLSTDRTGSQTIEIFLRTREQVQVWLDWLRDDLIDGAAWFSASWPQPQGGVGVRRFIGSPSYPQYLPKRGGWLVMAQCQMRGRGILPTRNYQNEVSVDRPLVWWKLDEPNGANVGADSGLIGLPLQINPTKTTLGVASLCAVGSALRVLSAGANPSIAAHNSAFNFGAGDFTLTALLKVSNAPASLSTIVGHGVTNADFGNWFLHLTSDGLFGLALYTANSNDAANRFTSPLSIADGLAHRIVARRNGSTITLIQDDAVVLTGEFALPIWSSTSQIGVGCTPWASGANPDLLIFDGVIDEVALWNRALSDERLQAQFRAL